MTHEDALEVQLTDEAAGGRDEKLLHIGVWLDRRFFGLGHMSLFAWMDRTANQSWRLPVGARKKKPFPSFCIEVPEPSTFLEIEVRTWAACRRAASGKRRRSAAIRRLDIRGFAYVALMWLRHRRVAVPDMQPDRRLTRSAYFFSISEARTPISSMMALIRSITGPSATALALALSAVA